MEVFREFTFSAAHMLPNVPEGHKCGRVHGHTFRVAIYITGPIAERSGWVQDFAEIREAFEPLSEQLDHRYLNDIAGLGNPTSENIARWIWKRLKPALPMLTKLIVWETPFAGVVYVGE